MVWPFGKGKRTERVEAEAEAQRVVKPQVDCAALLRELLDVELRAADVSAGRVKGWLMVRGVKGAVLAEGLPGFWVEEASAERLEALRVLAGLGLEGLSQVAGVLVRAAEPEVEKLEMENNLDLTTILGDQEWSSYCAFSSQERQSKIIQLNQLLHDVQTDEQKAEICRQIGRLWSAEGDSLTFLDAHQNALRSFEQAIELQPNFHKAWTNRGNSLDDLGRYEEAIASYDEALAIKPDSHEACYNRGNSLGNLGRYEEAIASYDKAVEIKPDYHEAWNNRGISLHKLGRNEEALASFDKAIEIKPDYHEACYNRGNSLGNLGRNEEALASYDKALEIKPDLHEAWNNRGNSLHKLGRYEEAIASYDKAIEIKPDYHEACYNRGNSLGNLGRYEEAIASYDKALEIKPDNHEAWFNRGTAFCRLGNPLNLPLLEQIRRQNLDPQPRKSHVEALKKAIPHLSEKTYGFGKIQLALGNAYLKHADKANPMPEWREALRSYYKAEKNIDQHFYPEDFLSVLWGVAHTHLLLNDPIETIEALLRRGSGLRDKIISQAITEEKKELLERTLPNFNQLTVDFHLRQGNPLTALATAEADKNALMTWLLAEAPAPSLSPDQIQQIHQQLPPHQAILYWHHSPNRLTPFLLRPNHPITPHPITPPTPQTALQQITQLETWLKTWNQGYKNHIDKSKTQPKHPKSDWYNTLPDQLNQLAQILQIDALKTQLPPEITHLTLIPHRDLHRLPLHAFFTEYQTTVLPSLQMGQLLRPPMGAPGETNSRTNRCSSLPQPTALTISAPNHEGLAALYHAEAETHLIQALLRPTHSITPISAPDAHKTTVQTALAQGHQILHFNGHASYNFDDPKQSALALANTDLLTVQDLRQISLRSYSLITLASCETALSGNQTITAEYVGLTSALLAQGIPHVLSTIWTVESAASMVFMVEFYRHLQQHPQLGPVAALHHSRQTLPSLTVAQLKTRYDQWLRLDLPANVREFLEEEQGDLDTMEPEQIRYGHPYYWAAFTLTGTGA